MRRATYSVDQGCNEVWQAMVVVSVTSCAGSRMAVTVIKQRSCGGDASASTIFVNQPCIGDVICQCSGAVRLPFGRVEKRRPSEDNAKFPPEWQ